MHAILEPSVTFAQVLMVIDFLEFKGTKVLEGDRAARYMKWVAHMRRNPPGKKP